MKTKEDEVIEETFWQYSFETMLHDLLYLHKVPCTKIRTAVTDMVEQVCKGAEKDENL